MTSAFSWQNSISLCPASFCILTTEKKQQQQIGKIRRSSTFLTLVSQKRESGWMRDPAPEERGMVGWGWERALFSS